MDFSPRVQPETSRSQRQTRNPGFDNHKRQLIGLPPTDKTRANRWERTLYGDRRTPSVPPESKHVNDSYHLLEPRQLGRPITDPYSDVSPQQEKIIPRANRWERTLYSDRRTPSVPPEIKDDDNSHHLLDIREFFNLKLDPIQQKYRLLQNEIARLTGLERRNLRSPDIVRQFGTCLEEIRNHTQDVSNLKSNDPLLSEEISRRGITNDYDWGVNLIRNYDLSCVDSMKTTYNNLFREFQTILEQIPSDNSISQLRELIDRIREHNADVHSRLNSSRLSLDQSYLTEIRHRNTSADRLIDDFTPSGDQTHRQLRANRIRDRYNSFFQEHQSIQGYSSIDKDSRLERLINHIRNYNNYVNYQLASDTSLHNEVTQRGIIQDFSNGVNLIDRYV